MRCLRKLLCIRWQDKVPDTEVLQKANMKNIHAFLKRFQLRWAEHVFRMPDERLPFSHSQIREIVVSAREGRIIIT